MRFQDRFSSVAGRLSSKSRIVEIVNHDGEAEAGNKNVSRQKSIANFKGKGSRKMMLSNEVVDLKEALKLPIIPISSLESNIHVNKQHVVLSLQIQISDM
jgi:hypothetical protein